MRNKKLVRLEGDLPSPVSLFVGRVPLLLSRVNFSPKKHFGSPSRVNSVRVRQKGVYATTMTTATTPAKKKFIEIGGTTTLHMYHAFLSIS